MLSSTFIMASVAFISSFELLTILQRLLDSFRLLFVMHERVSSSREECFCSGYSGSGQRRESRDTDY